MMSYFVLLSVIFHSLLTHQWPKIALIQLVNMLLCNFLICDIIQAELWGTRSRKSASFIGLYMYLLIKYARVRFSQTMFFPQKVTIYNFVLIRENTGYRNPYSRIFYAWMCIVYEITIIKWMNSSSIPSLYVHALILHSYLTFKWPNPTLLYIQPYPAQIEILIFSIFIESNKIPFKGKHLYRLNKTKSSVPDLALPPYKAGCCRLSPYYN